MGTDSLSEPRQAMNERAEASLTGTSTLTAQTATSPATTRTAPNAVLASPGTRSSMMAVRTSARCASSGSWEKGSTARSSTLLMRMGSAGGAIESFNDGGGGGRLLFVFTEVGGGGIDGAAAGLGIWVFVGAAGGFGTTVAGRGGGALARGTTGDGNTDDALDFFVISKSGFVPAGGGGIAAFVRVAAASASACTSADIVMPLGNVSVNIRRGSSSSGAVASATGGFGRGATGAAGLPRAPVGNLGAGGMVGG